MAMFDFFSGKPVELPSDYGDEVLNAGWLPPLEARIEARAESGSPARDPVQIDPEAFLRTIYRAQE